MDREPRFSFESRAMPGIPSVRIQRRSTSRRLPPPLELPHLGANGSDTAYACAVDLSDRVESPVFSHCRVRVTQAVNVELGGVVGIELGFDYQSDLPTSGIINKEADSPMDAPEIGCAETEALVKLLMW